MLRFSFWYARVEWWILVSLLVAIPAFAQDASTGAIRGTVVDSAGRPIVDASIALVDSAQGFRYFVTSDAAGQFVFEFLPSGEYAARAVAPDMSPQITPKLHVDIGATTQLDFKLQVGGAKEMVTVSGDPPMVETQTHAVSSLVDKRAIEELPLDGRRFTDLALLTPGVTQDRGASHRRRMGIWHSEGSVGTSPAIWSTEGTTTMHFSLRLAAGTGLPTSSPKKWCRSFVFPRIRMARNWEEPEAR